MSTVERQVGQARRRLTQNVLMERACLGVLVAAGLWALTTLVARTLALDVPVWHGAWAAALLAALIALIATAVARPTALQAAIALDSAAGLKERLSTALVLGGQPDPFVRAAVQDAEQTAGRIHVPAHIRHRAPSLWPWSAAATLAAVILVCFMPTLHLFGADRGAKEGVPRAAVEAEQKVIKTELDDRLNKIKELTRDNPNLKDLVKDIKPLDMPQEPGVTPEDVRREAVKTIDEVCNKLRRELDATERNPLDNAKNALDRLNEQPGSAANDKLSQALAGGDLKGAQAALKDMLAQINDAAKNADDPAAKAKLEEMQAQLARLADQLSKLSDSTQIQKELQNKAGLSEEEARKLAEELSKMDPKQLEKELQKRLGDKGMSKKQAEEVAKKIQQKAQQQQQAKQQCQNLSKQLAKAAKGCQQCNNPGSGQAQAGASQAANALSDAMGQLSEMEMTEQLANELQAQISDLQNLRDSVCQGDMSNQPGKRSDQVGSQGPQYGLGSGSRIGKEATPFKLDPSKAKSRYDSAQITGTMFIDGPQVRGQATADELNAAEAEIHDAQDAVERNEIPRQYQKALREYFERLAGLVQERKSAAGAASGGDAKP